MFILDADASLDIQRSEAFTDYARRVAEGEVMIPPLYLDDEDRRLHIRQTLREDHQFRIHNRPEGAQAKFDKLADNPYTFYRGTALLFYRDYAGTDGHLPTLLAIGDIHPENFGVMPNQKGEPFFGINDFDEAHFAPFSWDVKRGAVGFYLASWMNRFKRKHRRRAVRAFARGYVEGLKDFATSDNELRHELTIDNSPPMIRDLLERARRDRSQWLEKYIDVQAGQFVPDEKIEPRHDLVEKFQAVVDDYRQRNEIPTDTRAGHFRVKDVAMRHGSGTASLGLDRYFVLVDGHDSGRNDDDIILEIKQCRHSALRGLTPPSAGMDDQKAERIIRSHDVHTVAGDPYYGVTDIDGHEFIVRERSPFKKAIKLQKLDKKGMRKYAEICGRVLAQAHARSDEDTGVMEGDAEDAILTSIRPELFIGDIVRFAERGARRIKRDWELFRDDHAAGGFRLTIRQNEE